MSFDVNKTYIRNRLEGLGYIESKSAFNFADAPSTEYDKSFILLLTDGAINPDGENINARMYDNQTWQVQIAFAKSTHNDVIKRDDMYRSIEAIIKDLDNPNNYGDTVRKIRYESWEVEESQNYFLLKINFNVQDKYTY
jgi:hypothetical protein